MDASCSRRTDPYGSSTIAVRQSRFVIQKIRDCDPIRIPIFFGLHSDPSIGESTVRYLGIEVDDAIAIAEQVEV